MEEKFKCLTNEFGAVNEGDIITIIDGVAIDSEGSVLQVDLDCVRDKKYFHEMVADARVKEPKAKKKKVEKVTEIIKDNEEAIVLSEDVVIGDYIIIPDIFDSAKTLDIAKSLAESMLETVPKVYIAKLKHCARSERKVFWD